MDHLAHCPDHHQSPCSPNYLCVLEFNDGTPPFPMVATTLDDAKELGRESAALLSAVCGVLVFKHDGRIGGFLLLEGDVLEKMAA